jgi:hypothetical protein
MKDQDTIHQNHRGGRGFQDLSGSGVGHKIIDRNIRGESPAKLGEAGREPWKVETVRMVEVHGSAIMIKAMGLIDVEIILIQDRRNAFPQSLVEGSSEIGLS